jgi:hypothetical protein
MARSSGTPYPVFTLTFHYSLLLRHRPLYILWETINELKGDCGKSKSTACVHQSTSLAGAPKDVLAISGEHCQRSMGVHIKCHPSLVIDQHRTVKPVLEWPINSRLQQIKLWHYLVFACSIGTLFPTPEKANFRKISEWAQVTCNVSHAYGHSLSECLYL